MPLFSTNQEDTSVNQLMRYVQDILDRQEQRLSRHELQEDKLFEKVVNALNDLKQDIHELSNKVITNNSDLNLKIIVMKDDILKICYEEMALKRDLEENKAELADKIAQLRREAYILYFALGTVAVIVAWLIDQGVLKLHG